MAKRSFVNVLLALWISAPLAAQENPLAAARELYASARYDEALAVLNGLRPPDASNPAERKSIEQYRSLCLLALGRGLEAETAIAAVVTADPTYQPTEAEASPRVRTAFSEVRQRLLPDIARLRYAAAKATFDRKEYGPAEQQFRALLALLDDPDMGGKLADLRVLAQGFVELAVAGAAPPADPRKDTPPPPPPPQASPLKIYTMEDAGVTAPVPIRQELPRVPSQVASQARERGLLEVVIDEQGRVTGLTLRVSLHPVYDSLLLASARDWRYQPAVFAGKPVKFRKVIQISLAK